MKSKVIAALVAVGMMVSVANAEILLQDEFDSKDVSTWNIFREGSSKGGRYIDNSAVLVTNGVLKIIQDQTDNGPTLISKDIYINERKLIKIERKIKVHAANHYYLGGVSILNSNNNRMCQITYANFDYEWKKNAFVLNDGDARYGQNISPVWDEWIVETLIFSPSTGWSRYEVNGNSVIEKCKPLTDNTIKLLMQSYGWWTGHEIDIDYIRVEQIDKDNDLNNHINQLKREQEEANFKIVKFRKNLQEGDETSNGLVVQIKGNLVKIQTNDSQCSQRDYEGTCKNWINTPVEKWIKRSEIYPK